ncbi:ribosome-binding factor A, partial [Pseudomonas fluorescens]|uniref:ribosome-binding factor A n=1 Tax=Pseudomonas fluorescens TaxID=294 RepID=UPI003825D4B9
MAKEYSRTQRIGDQMQRELAQLIRREVKDPRVGLVTITAVEVSRAGGQARGVGSGVGGAEAGGR